MGPGMLFQKTEIQRKIGSIGISANMEAKDKKRCTAIILAAGQGRRMGADVQKQYIELEGKPVIYYTLKAFQDSEVIDDIIPAVGSEEEIHDCSELVQEYQFTKVDCHSAWRKGTL